MVIFLPFSACLLTPLLQVVGAIPNENGIFVAEAIHPLTQQIVTRHILHWNGDTISRAEVLFATRLASDDLIIAGNLIWLGLQVIFAGIFMLSNFGTVQRYADYRRKLEGRDFGRKVYTPGLIMLLLGWSGVVDLLFGSVLVLPLMEHQRYYSSGGFGGRASLCLSLISFFAICGLLTTLMRLIQGAGCAWRRS